MKTYSHHLTGLPMIGLLLAAGAVLRPTDVYSSTGGKWESCPVTGLKLGETETIWVRPTAMTEGEVRLLKLMASTTMYNCIAVRGNLPYAMGKYTFVPFANWNDDDGRVALPYLINDEPKSIQPLVDLGFLRSHGGEYYSITDAGREAAKQIVS